MDWLTMIMICCTAIVVTGIVCFTLVLIAKIFKVIRLKEPAGDISRELAKLITVLCLAVSISLFVSSFVFCSDELFLIAGIFFVGVIFSGMIYIDRRMGGSNYPGIPG